jgi:hypothetical protein
MMTNGCNGYQAILLDHLYGLLEPAEEQSLRAHLASCEPCRRGLEQARSQQRLLAAAALQAFPEVSFSPPAPEPAVLPIRPLQKKSPRRWTGWVAAAAVLLALAPAALFGSRAASDYLEARRVASQHAQAIARARAEMDATSRQLAKAARERDQAIEAIRKEVRDRELRLVVSGPRTVQAGATAEYLVRTVGPDGKPADADLLVSLDLPGRGGVKEVKGEAKGGEGSSGNSGSAVKDGGSKPASSGKGDAGAGAAEAWASLEPRPRVARVDRGLYRIQLPPTLPVEAGRTLAMKVTATRPGVKAESEARPLSLTGDILLTKPVYLTHLTTDRPMYQPGEVVRFRSLTLDRATLTPPAEQLLLRYTLTPPSGAEKLVAAGRSLLRQLDPASRKGAEALGPDGKPLAGLGAGEALLPADAPGGEYTLTVHEASGRFQPVRRKFIVNEYRKPRLDRKLELNRPSYGPGDEVQVLAQARRVDGGPLGDIPVEGALFVDGHRAATASARLSSGEAVLRFRLPASMQRGLASVSVEFRDPGTPETSTRPVPVVLGHLDVEMFPEGGDLVAGLPGRVYFSARTPAGKPARLSGTLLEDGKPLPVKAETLQDDREPGVNQGLGSFTFTPRAGKSYTLRIDSPANIAPVPLPAVRPDGVALHVGRGVFHPEEEILVRAESSSPRHLLVGAYCRDTLLDSAHLEPGQSRAVLHSASPVGGVCRITVFEVAHTGGEQKQLKPVAERLVYRHPGKRVDVSILPSSKQYAPADRARLKVLATDEKERRAPVVAQVAVVDQGTLSLADERTARAMPTHFLLASEVRRAEDLEHADFLIGQSPRAPEVLDHLLGTQGWRRFAEQSPQQFRGKMREDSDGERLLVMMGQSAPQRTDFDEERVEKALSDYEEVEERLLAAQEEASEQLKAASADPALLAALATIENNHRMLNAARQAVLPVLGLVALAAALWALTRMENSKPALLTGLCGAVCAVLFVALASLSTLPPPAPRENQLALARELDKAGPRDREELAAGPNFGAGGGEGGPGAAVPAAPGGMAGGGRGGALPTPPRAGIAQPVPPPGDGGPPGLALENKDLADGRNALAFGRNRHLAENVRRAPALPGAAPLPDIERDLPGLAPGMPARPGRPPGLEDGLDRARGLFRLSKKDHASFYPPLTYRVYAHVRPEGLALTTREDGAETVYWHPVLVLPEGEAEVEFQLPDSVTRFQAAVYAHTLDGRLGAATRLIETRLPVNLSARLPAEVSDNDRPIVPIAVASTVDRPIDGTITLTAKEGLQASGEAQAFRLSAHGTSRVLLPIQPSLRAGKASLTLEARGREIAGDSIRESLRIVPEGFPVEGSSSDLLEKSATHKVSLPADLIPGSLTMRVEVFPSPLADLSRGLEGLLREPNGCFEQTSTTNYPNTLILSYLKASGAARPDVESRARALLAKGYARLVSFECQDPATKGRRGYEWFGGTAPPHDALTAYGLLQFHDMARLHPVDSGMMQRTRAYLLSLRDGKGGFRRSTKALDQFGGAPAHVTAAYIVWALTETGTEDLSAEQEALLAEARKSEDAYFRSLVALGLAGAGKAAQAKELLDQVARSQKADGSLDAETSITRSGGVDLKIEATALSVLAWLKADRAAYARHVNAAAKWIGTQRQGSGSFGSTQATILALKALLAQSASVASERKDADLVLYHGEKEIARTQVPASATGSIALEVPNPESIFRAGVADKLRAELSNGAAYPHTFSWTCRAVKPANEASQLVSLAVSLSKPRLTEGETARVTVRVTNKTGQAQGMATAIIGLPAGLALPESLEQMRAHCKLPADGKAPRLSAFEVRGREVVLYWRGLEAGQSVEVPFDVIARVPGSYRGPASRAYLYYSSRNKHWVEPLAAEIQPAG